MWHFAHKSSSTRNTSRYVDREKGDWSLTENLQKDPLGINSPVASDFSSEDGIVAEIQEEKATKGKGRAEEADESRAKRAVLVVPTYHSWRKNGWAYEVHKMEKTKKEWQKTLRTLYANIPAKSYFKIIEGQYMAISEVTKVWTLRLISLLSNGQVSTEESNVKG